MSSISQYKSRINKWKLDKNNKEGEMRTVVRLHQERSKVHKRSIFKIRDRQIHLQEAIRYFSRKGKSIDDLDPGRAPVAAPTVRCLSPLLPTLESPTELQSIECILSAAKSYSRGYFDGLVQYSNQSDSHFTITSTRLIDEFDRGLKLVKLLFDQKAYQEGGQALLAVTAYSKEIIETCSPYVLSRILITLASGFHTLNDIALAIVKHFGSLAKGMFPKQNHPLMTIFLSTANRCKDISTVFFKSARIILDEMTVKFGADHGCAFQLRCIILDSFESDQSTKVKNFRELLNTAQSSLSTEVSYLSIKIRRFLYLHYLSLEDCVQAAQMAAALDQHSPKLWQPDKVAKLRDLAAIQSGLRNFQMAMQHISEAIEFEMSTENPRDFQMVDLLFYQEYGAIALGDSITAMEARRRRIEIIQQINGGEIGLKESDDFVHQEV